MKRRQAWTLYKKEEETAIEELCSGYRRFLDAGKTERECIKEAVRLAKKKGYRKLSECRQIKPGDKVYAVHSSKTAVFFQIGTDLQGTASAAFRIIGAHVDSPRLDVKQVPLYEESNQVYLDTIITEESRSISGYLCHWLCMVWSYTKTGRKHWYRSEKKRKIRFL